MAKKPKAEQPVEEKQVVSNIIGGESDDFAFQYDSSLEDAVAPEPLPENKYKGEITDFRKGVSQLTNRDQFTLRIVIPVENYPADYSSENAPDGTLLLWYSPDVDKSKRGMWNMKTVCDALKIPLTTGVKPEDFIGKQVEVDLEIKDLPDGSRRNRIRGLPTAV